MLKTPKMDGEGWKEDSGTKRTIGGGEQMEGGITMSGGLEDGNKKKKPSMKLVGGIDGTHDSTGEVVIPVAKAITRNGKKS